MGEIRTFNFVNSIKGGCGKTTFSVFLAHYLGEESVILDMDLQGTAMQWLFKGNNEEERKGKYLNDAVRKCEIFSDYVDENQVEGRQIKAVFANPTGKAKNQYRVSAQGNYSQAVKTNVFRDGLKEFLNKADKAMYSHFIFDMPPNSDGFTDAAMECVLVREHSIAEEKDKINLFYVLGLDAGHMNATIEEIRNLLGRKDYKEFDKLFIVFNDNISREHNEANDKIILKIKLEKFRESLCGLKEATRKKIYFALMATNEAYATYCIEGNGLQNVSPSASSPPSNIIPELPFSEFAKFADGEFKPMSEYKFMGKDGEEKTLKEFFMGENLEIEINED